PPVTLDRLKALSCMMLGYQIQAWKKKSIMTHRGNFGHQNISKSEASVVSVERIFLKLPFLWNKSTEESHFLVLVIEEEEEKKRSNNGSGQSRKRKVKRNYCYIGYGTEMVRYLQPFPKSPRLSRTQMRRQQKGSACLSSEMMEKRILIRDFENNGQAHTNIHPQQCSVHGKSGENESKRNELKRRDSKRCLCQNSIWLIQVHSKSVEWKEGMRPYGVMTKSSKIQDSEF
ncbi:hypothetical protein STEG23_030435, partial [Scotinomys teguina]